MQKENFGLEVMFGVLKMTVWSFSLFTFIDYCRGIENWLTTGGSWLFLFLTHSFTIGEIKGEIQKLSYRLEK
jgi:hypothetical protein